MTGHTRYAAATLLLAIALTTMPGREAAALILGDVGNKPVNDPGWPKGAAALFNHPGRVAWWEGPPFGGGQWHAECRGDARALNAVLADFAKLDVKTRQVFVHDGVGHSVWLGANREPAKPDDAKIDWIFMVWQGGNWERLRKLPSDLNPTNSADAGKGPPSSIDVFCGGQIHWSDVVIPNGVEVIDGRLEAHGFTPADGVVIEGKIIDLATAKPLAAKVRLQRVEPQPKGGYLYSAVAEVDADVKGHWVFKKVPAGWLRVVAEAEGFVPRVAGYAQFDAEPRWTSYDCGLARPGTVTGRVIDDAGKPLKDVEVRLANVVPAVGGRYESPGEYVYKTDSEGRFQTGDQVPAGRATIWVHKPGYCRPGLGQPITTPTKDVELTMLKSAEVRVRVDFTGKVRPEGYIVGIKPEGGEVIGSWGGSGNLDAVNQISFKDVPPGRYILIGRPNPSGRDEETDPVTVDLKGGEAIEVTLFAR